MRWAGTVQRPLPWRGERDPYRVLVSEVMLQQTQASRVSQTYGAFLTRFPTTAALARATARDVLVAWAGLGYNRRALNLWRAAQSVEARGSFPSSVEQLRALPGVGRYTACAVASFAFGLDEAVVETNVRRIVARLDGLDPKADREVWARAQDLLPKGRAAAWNQALMDLGATVCTPRNPACGACPLRRSCRSAGRVTAMTVRRAPARFVETRRYVRGRVLAALCDAPHGLTASALVRTTGLPRQRAKGALDGLVRDGLVHLAARRVYAGPR